MSFKTLEQRFLEKSRNIYTQYNNPEALVTILPDSNESRQKVKDDIRLAPFGFSLSRDKLRIKRLNQSALGSRFTNTQLALQTQNTFAETRLYNPANLLLNGVPSLNIPRHINFSILGPKEYAGALQKGTVDSFTNSGAISGFVKGLVTTVLSPITALISKPELTNNGFYVRPEDKVQLAPDVFNPSFSAVGLPVTQLLKDRGQRKQVGLYQGIEDQANSVELKIPLGTKQLGQSLQYYNRYKARSFPFSSAPYLSLITGFNTLDIRASKFKILKGVPNASAFTSQIYTASDFVFQVPPPKSDQVNTFDKSLSVFRTQKHPLVTVDPVNKSNKTYLYSSLENYNLTNGVLKGGLPYRIGMVNGNFTFEEGISQPTKTQDPYNLDSFIVNSPNGTSRTPITENQIDYSSIYAPDEASVKADSLRKGVADSLADLIKFEFRDVKDANPVRFRALISSLKESVKTEFNEARYVGRVERYVTYNGAKRSVNMTFNVIAFSQDEIQNVWKRINYLSGLAFPKGVTQSGFMVPPLFKITIGGIYEMQPAYIDTLSYDFIDNDTVFDIDVPAGGVPQYIKVDMAMTLMEKRSKFFDSPFYKIVEDKAADELEIETQRRAAAATAAEVERQRQFDAGVVTSQEELDQAIARAYGYAGTPLDFGTNLSLDDEAQLYTNAMSNAGPRSDLQGRKITALAAQRNILNEEARRQRIADMYSREERTAGAERSESTSTSEQPTGQKSARPSTRQRQRSPAPTPSATSGATGTKQPTPTASTTPGATGAKQPTPSVGAPANNGSPANRGAQTTAQGSPRTDNGGWGARVAREGEERRRIARLQETPEGRRELIAQDPAMRRQADIARRAAEFEELGKRYRENVKQAGAAIQGGLGGPSTLPSAADLLRPGANPIPRR